MINKTILHYKILDKLGAGGMGVVYLAEDTRLKRQVAIKFLPPHVAATDEDRQRFEIEAQAAAALNHPNIATIHAIEESDGQIFIVMEYIRGRELSALIAEAADTPLPPETIIELMSQIADGLEAAHGLGIIHRDIKSANIMLTDSGQIKIMDFGLAKMENAGQVTQAGATLGTAVYMSPQQVKGEAADKQTDIWALGVIFYELIGGRQPFAGAYEQAVMYAILNETPFSLRAMRENISPEMERIVFKCLEKNLESRYATVAEFRSDLGNINAAQPAEEAEPVKKRKEPAAGERNKKKRNIYYIVGALLLMALTTVIFQLLPTDGFRFSPEPDAEQKHLLILPLNNIGDDKSREAFCEGLLEILTSKMSELEQFHGNLWIVPTSEVLQNKLTSPGQAYKIFGANLAVSGSLQLVNEIYRLTLNLIDARQMRQLNSAIISVSAANLADLHAEAVEKLLGMLELEINSASKSQIARDGSQNSEAFAAYITGQGFLQRYENFENIQMAVENFKTAVRLDEKYASAFAGLGEAYWRAYETDKNINWIDSATTACLRAVELNPKLAPVNITLGLIHSGSGKYGEALKDFRRALEIAPNNAEAWRGLAGTHEALEMPTEAEAAYKKAIELKSGYWAGYNDLGVFYFRNARYDEAIVQFKKITLLAPENHRGYNNLGGIYYMTERYGEAREMFEKSLAIKKTYRVCSNLGTLYFIEGKYTESAKMFEAALELNQSDYVIWGNLAEASFWASGDRAETSRHYEKAIALAEARREVNPNDANILSDLAGYHASVNRAETAKNLIRRALELAPKNTRVLYRAGSVFEVLGDRKQALRWLKAALENGYSATEISHQPELKALLGDPKYVKIVENLKTTANQ